ncbi:hypothetical protein G9P44_001186 [Scheffersomyces stipitis]|nr:hypothetical protein G9P44_001186 [Scheffersomyces stipitis]
MSSPIKSAQSPTRGNEKVIFDETFSPVKLPVDKEIATEHHRTPEVVIHHPHGLSAKHDARRTSIHATNRRSMVNTPLVPTTIPLLSSTSKKAIYPMTQPRVNKSVNLDSIKRAKVRLDSKLNGLLSKNDTGKENRNPFESSPTPRIDINSSIVVVEDSRDNSSPLKRQSHVGHDSGSSKKIAKVVTNADEATDYHISNTSSQYSKQVDEAFFKEDLVGQLSSSKSSPVVSKVADENVNVIDNDSDSDPEDYGRIETTISQTIIPNATFNGKTFSNSMNSDNHTQLNKIIRLESNSDYITPQRQTEPVARSPATNQLVRINEALVVDDADDESANNKSDLKDATSPLKNHMPKLAHKDRNEYDDDENGNEDEDLLEGEKLANEPTINFLMSPNSKPVFSLEQISKMRSEYDKKSSELNEQISAKDQRIVSLSKELTLANDLLMKLEQQVRDLKESNNKLISNEDILSIQLKHNERELASLTKNFKIKENSVAYLRKKLNTKKEEYEETKAQLQDTESNLRTLRSEFNESNNLNIENTIKIEKLLKEKEDAWNQLEKQKNLYSELQVKFESKEEYYVAKVKELTKQNSELLAANSENESLIKDFENVTNTKIVELETTIADIHREKEEVSKRLAKSAEYVSEIESLKESLHEAQSANKKLEFKVNHFEDVNRNLKLDYEKAEAQSKNKDEIIAEDVAKLNELVDAVNKKDVQHREDIEALELEVAKLKNGRANALEEVESLKRQVDQTKQESDEEVKRLAHYLHREYAEKHVKKLGDVKSHYEKEKDRLIRERKIADRDNELLRMKLNNCDEEIRQLTEILEVNKLQYSGGRLSPKRSNGGRSNRY